MQCRANIQRCRCTCPWGLVEAPQHCRQRFRVQQCAAQRQPRCAEESNHQPHDRIISRRQTLAGISAVLGLAAPGTAKAVTSDLVEGTQNWFNIGVQSYGLWAQSVVDGISNDDQTGLTAAEVPRRRRFGNVTVPGLSSFSFIHGTLVGGALILLLSFAGKGSGQQQQQQPELVEQPALRPDVEAALRRLLAAPDTSATFHDPAVHAALQDVRGDLRNITKYRDDPAVMQAFEKLLEIEDILERL